MKKLFLWSVLFFIMSSLNPADIETSDILQLASAPIVVYVDQSNVETIGTRLLGDDSAEFVDSHLNLGRFGILLHSRKGVLLIDPKTKSMHKFRSTGIFGGFHEDDRSKLVFFPVSHESLVGERPAVVIDLNNDTQEYTHGYGNYYPCYTRFHTKLGVFIYLNKMLLASESVVLHDKQLLDVGHTGQSLKIGIFTREKGLQPRWHVSAPDSPQLLYNRILGKEVGSELYKNTEIENSGLSVDLIRNEDGKPEFTFYNAFTGKLVRTILPEAVAKNN